MFLAMKRCLILFAALLAATAPALADSPAVTASIWDTNVLCLRVSQVTPDFPKQLRASQPAGRTTGTILDLRFADGDSGSEDAAVKLFSTNKMPLVILVNSQTRGAAAALAAQLRATAAAIVIGSTNPPGKVSPDIAVATSADDEKKFQENPLAKTSANQPGALSATNNLLTLVDHMSEAELVRKHLKDGEEEAESVPPPQLDAAPFVAAKNDAPDGGPAASRAEPPQPVIRDPALARAVDLLKALAVLHKARG